MRLLRTSVAGLAFAAAFAVSGPAAAEMMEFTATLTGGEEVPAVETAATGTATASYDTETMALTYSVEFSGLSGPATAAHFHGPAAMGANADPVVPIEDVESPLEGTATLTEAQAADLTAGNWYANVHTEANPGGEIRGQVTQGM